MTLSYKEISDKIFYEIKQLQKEQVELSKTLDEVTEYGWTTTFNTDNEDNTIKSAFDCGFKIGEIEGKIDQLNSFLNFFYGKEMETNE